MVDKSDTPGKFDAAGNPIQEYPKWVRNDGREALVNSKDEEDTFNGNAPKASNKPKEWGK